MSKGNWTNKGNFSADALLFGTTSVPLGTGTLTNGYVLTYNAGTLSLSPTAAGPANPLSDVLLAGNTTGASNIVISSPQQITYAGGITIASSSANSNVIIGPSATSTALANGLSVGAGAQSSATGASSFGANANASGTNAFALGASSTASGTDSLGLGNGASTAGFASSVALGPGATNTAANQIMLGTNAFSVVNPGSLSFSTGLAVGNTTNLLTLPKIAGTPSGAATSGSLAYDSTNNLFYGRNNAAWVQIQTGAAATPSLSSVLAAGNTTGANDIVVSSNRTVRFIDMVRIGSDGIDPLSGLSTTAIMIGRGTGNTISGNVINSTCVGWSATCSGSNSTIIGAGASGTGSSAVAVGQGATSAASSTSVGAGAAASANNSTSVGWTATCSTSVQGVVVGSQAALGTNCTNSILMGFAGTSLASITDAIGIGRAASLVSIDAIGIGRQVSASGTRAVTIGAAGANHANNSDCVLVGANVANLTTGGTGCTILGASSSSVGGVVNTTLVGSNSSVAAATSVGVGDHVTIAATCTNSTVVGSGASMNGTCTNSVIYGSNAAIASGGNSNVCVGAGTTMNGFANSIQIGAGGICYAAGCVTLGAQQNSSGTNSITVGRNNNLSQASSNFVFGNNCSDTRVGGNSQNTLLGDSCTITNGSLSARNVALMCNTTIPAGITDRLYANTNFASTTSAAGTTLSVDADGRIHANTSSIRYKQNVKPLHNPERILGLRAVEYSLKNSPEVGMSCGCPDHIVDEDPESPTFGEDIPNTCDGLHATDVGLIAEELANAGMEDFVVFRPDPKDPSKKQCLSVKYERLVGPLIEVVKSQRDMLEDYQRRLEALESKMALAFGM